MLGLPALDGAGRAPAAPDEYLQVVTDRNRDKITRAEQRLLRTKRVGVLGLSVGAEAAVVIAQEHLCGHLVLADFDRLELSNLNRLGAGHADIGLPKTRIAARRIAAIDPYLEVSLVEDEITRDNAGRFLHGLDLLVEECDSAAAKYDTRTAARELGLNVVYAADERGFLSVEPYATHPGLPRSTGWSALTSRPRPTASPPWSSGWAARRPCPNAPGTRSASSAASCPDIPSSPAKPATPPGRSPTSPAASSWANASRPSTVTWT
ncbi:ThiF family adenylyltransferase [Nonomuraea antimicrobica]